MNDTATVIEKSVRQQQIDQVRELLTWLEDNPDVPMPYGLADGTFNLFIHNKDKFMKCAKLMGQCKKVPDKNFYTLRKNFGTINLDLNAYHNEICERVVVGTEEIPEKIIPEQVIPASTKEIVEWRCPSILKD